MSLPPRHPSSTSNDASLSAHLKNSNTPSEGSGNAHGIRWVEHHLRSVLSHEYAVPLCFLMRDGHLENCPRQFGYWNYECEEQTLVPKCDKVLSSAFDVAYEARPAKKTGKKRAKDMEKVALTSGKKKGKKTGGDKKSGDEESRTQAVSNMEEINLASGAEAGEAETGGDEESGETAGQETSKMEEVALTNAIHDKLHESFSEHFTSKKQDPVENPSKSLGGDTKEKGKIDVSLSRKDGSPLLVMEVGLSHEKWWQKVDQNVQYACAKARNSDQPFLFSVLTMQNQDNGAEAVNIHLGVFLIVGEEKMRTCLINRRSVRGLHNCSQAFGKLIFACLNMIKWSEGKDSTKFSYLGPNCCKVETSDGPMVLRSYDSRCRETQRSWRVYESLVRVGVAGRQYHCRKLFEMHDEKIDTGVALPPLSDIGVFALFKYDGFLTVISVPYFEGGHVASAPECFLGPVEDLSKLNENELVHADMRCTNIVHSEDGEFNCVIDYDFAGKIDEGEYPQNYNPSIPDGSRAPNIAVAGLKLSKVADWYALGCVIFMCYSWEWMGEGDEQAGKFRKLERYFTHLVLKPEAAAGVEDMVKELKEFLQTAGRDWTIEPRGDFAGLVSKRRLRSTRKSTEDATGSPPKQQAK